MLAAFLALPAIGFGAAASPPPLPPAPTVPMPPMNFTASYNVSTHTVHLHWQVPLDAGNQSIEYRVYINGVLDATVEVTAYNQTIGASPTVQTYTVSAYYPHATSASRESAPTGAVFILGQEVCPPIMVTVITTFPFVDIVYDPGCLPFIGPGHIVNCIFLRWSCP